MLLKFNINSYDEACTFQIYAALHPPTLYANELPLSNENFARNFLQHFINHFHFLLNLNCSL